MKWILTKDNHVYSEEDNLLAPIDKEQIKKQSDDIFELIDMYDFVYTKSDQGEDVGFVNEIYKNGFTVTFTFRCKKVHFYIGNDKKLRLIKEIWKPTNERTYRKVWERN